MQTVSLPHPYKTMCKDKKLSGIKAYTIAACHDHCKKEYIAKECGCNPFYVTGNAIIHFLSAKVISNHCTDSSFLFLNRYV